MLLLSVNEYWHWPNTTQCLLLLSLIAENVIVVSVWKSITWLYCIQDSKWGWLYWILFPFRFLCPGKQEVNLKFYICKYLFGHEENNIQDILYLMIYILTKQVQLNDIFMNNCIKMPTKAGRIQIVYASYLYIRCWLSFSMIRSHISNKAFMYFIFMLIYWMVCEIWGKLLH